MIPMSENIRSDYVSYISMNPKFYNKWGMSESQRQFNRAWQKADISPAQTGGLLAVFDFKWRRW